MYTNKDGIRFKLYIIMYIILDIFKEKYLALK